jgi:hypothetical protein
MALHSTGPNFVIRSLMLPIDGLKVLDFVGYGCHCSCWAKKDMDGQIGSTIENEQNIRKPMVNEGNYTHLN